MLTFRGDHLPGKNLHDERPWTAHPATIGHDTFEITDITADVYHLDSFDNNEHVWLGSDTARVLTTIVSIHTTVLGIALGGTRIWLHKSFETRVTDAVLLLRGINFKSAIADART